MQNKREELHNKIGQFFKKNNVVLTKTQWLLTYFKDEISVTNLFNHIQTGKQKNPTRWNVVTESDLKTFFKTYPCDIVSSNFCQNENQPNNQPNSVPTISPKFQCLLNHSVFGGSIEPVTDNEVFFHTDDNRGEFHFFTDGKFYYKDNSYNQKIDGNWSCKGNNQFVCRTNDGYTFDSKQIKWNFCVRSL